MFYLNFITKIFYFVGDASARDIDTAMKLGAGYPMGIFRKVALSILKTALVRDFIIEYYRSF